MDAEAQDVFRKSAAHWSSALVATAVLPRRTRVLRPPDPVPGSWSTAGRHSGYDAGCTQPSHRNAEPRRPLLTRQCTLAPEPAAFSPHEAQQARRADYSPMEVSEPAATFIV
ncbi:hypothetical protein GCM10022295_81790 [Streptomyces osmaniensis]|uniref:Uncharacterized protein n=1 Tax=Streptomyces osmaniensis TaxID=593134 RepID=A0ABP6YQ45_9ACTN